MKKILPEIFVVFWFIFYYFSFKKVNVVMFYLIRYFNSPISKICYTKFLENIEMIVEILFVKKIKIMLDFNDFKQVYIYYLLWTVVLELLTIFYKIRSTKSYNKIFKKFINIQNSCILSFMKMLIGNIEELKNYFF